MSAVRQIARLYVTRQALLARQIGKTQGLDYALHSYLTVILHEARYAGR